MPCTPFSLPGGASGILCTRTLRPRCACGKPSAFQCDAPTKRSNGTCSRHLCAECATEAGPDLHLCRAHAGATPGPGRASAGEQQPEQQALEF